MTATTLGLSGSLLGRHWARRSLVSQALVGRGSSGDQLAVILQPNTTKSRKEDHDDEDKARGNHAISSRVVKQNTWKDTTATSLLVRSHSPLYHHHSCQHLQTHPQRRRAYHATPQQPLVLYGTIIIVVATGYVIYRKAQGKPISPDSLLDAKKEYHAAGGQYSRAAFERRQAQKMLQQQQQQQQQNEKAQEKLSSSESEQIKG